MAAFQLRGVGECMYVRFRIQTQLDEVGELRGWRVSPDRSILVLRHDSCVLLPIPFPSPKISFCLFWILVLGLDPTLVLILHENSMTRFS